MGLKIITISRSTSYNVFAYMCMLTSYKQSIKTIMKKNCISKSRLITATGGVSIARQLRHLFLEYRTVDMSVFDELEVRDK